MMQLSYCLSFCKSNFLPSISYQLCPVIIILHIIPFSFTLILFLLIYLIIIFPLLLLIRFPFPCSTFAFLMFSWTELPIKDETQRDSTQISRDPLYEKTSHCPIYNGTIKNIRLFFMVSLQKWHITCLFETMEKLSELDTFRVRKTTFSPRF